MKWRWLLTILFFLASCSEQTTGTSGNFETDDAGLDTFVPSETDSSSDSDDSYAPEVTYSIWTDPCVDCDQYFCPPLDSVWQKQICINNCTDPPTVVYEGECKEYLQCDPMKPIIEIDIPCSTEDGFPGTQNKICNKGQIQYTDCITSCDDEACNGLDDDCDNITDEGFSEIEEICNSVDDDCDGEVDEGEWECDNGCGPGPNLCVAGTLLCTAPEPNEEVCDYTDNDCDSAIDEGQLNACETCGLVPEEICDGYDNDCDDVIDEDLIQSCGTACGEGYETCVSGYWVSCTAPPALDEVCDGFDNDCDGQIDEELECVCTIQDVGSLFPCQESPLMCGKGYKTCECLDPICQNIVTTECYAVCYWLTDPPGIDLSCDPTIGMPLAKEDCNNFDDDCDQVIDEDIFAGCYTGPSGTVGVGICIPGEMTCDSGVWGSYTEQNLFMPGLCEGEITPQDELCNGLDDDCDGETDWGKQLQDTDILFILDWSGSMSDEQSAMLIALNKFAGTYSDEKVLQWGVVLGPRLPTISSGDEYLELYHNLSGFTNFLGAMSILNPYSMYGSREMLLDAIYLSVRNISASLPKPISDLDWHPWAVGESVPPHDHFFINWRANADRIVIVFTDEPAQSYMQDSANSWLSADDVTKAIQGTPQFKLFVFSTSLVWEWDELTTASNGKYFDLSNNPTEVYNSLMEILDGICMTGGDDAE